MNESYIPHHKKTATSGEMLEARKWIDSKFVDKAGIPPFSFIYNSQPSAETIHTWNIKRAEQKHDENRTTRKLIYTDPNTGLEVRCEGTEYSDYPAVEWVIYFKNTGDTDTPILENVRALDISVAGDGNFIVHHAKGTNSKIEDFQPFDDSLLPDTKLKINSFGVHPWGMSSVESLPFFNIESTGHGIIAAVGWTGAWSAGFIRDETRTVQVFAGMDTTHLLLHPNEEIRTPRMLLLFWQDDKMRAHNMWRRLILDHYTPRPGGKLLKAPLCDANWGEFMAAEQIGKINWWKENDLPMECYWIDAGWNGSKGEDCFEAAANRVPRADLYPEGMKPVSDAAHKCDMKFLLWTWPHIIREGVEIGAKHPEWILPGSGMDHGNPEVTRWMIDNYSKSVDEFGLDIFRQDGHSIYPLDTDPDRVGMSQIRYTEGFYEFWDGLLENHPNLIIDNCAGGGRKIDIETMQRSIPLWRSDYQCGPKGMGGFDPTGMQCQTAVLSQWIPLSAGVTETRTAYGFRSAYSPGLVLAIHGFDGIIDSKDYDLDLCRKLLNEFISLRPFFYGDYYPLTPYSLDADKWMAWQFDRPDMGEGILQAFRRPECTDESHCYKLFGLEPEMDYNVINLDIPGSVQMTGHELMTKGITVTLQQRPDAAVIKYMKCATKE